MEPITIAVIKPTFCGPKLILYDNSKFAIEFWINPQRLFTTNGKVTWYDIDNSNSNNRVFKNGSLAI